MTSSTRHSDSPVGGRRKSARLLVIYLAVCVGAVAAAALFRALDFHFWPCGFHLITGYYCLSCGATRAALALLQLDFARSVLLNPLPVMLAAFMAVLLGFETAGIIKNRFYPFRWLPHVVIGMLVVLVAFCLLRNFGLLPRPEYL